MNKHSYVFPLLLAFLLPVAGAQEVFDFSQRAVIERLKQDIYTLASEEMEGREAGTDGEKKAAAYIKQRMAEVGLQPLFNGSYLQEFPFAGGWVWGTENHFSYLAHSFSHGEDYYVLPGSGIGSLSAPFVHVGYGLSGLVHLEGFEDYCDYALHGEIDGYVAVMDIFMPEALDTLVDMAFLQIIQQKVRTASEKGAAGIVFVNTRSERGNPPVDLRISRQLFDFPVIFAEDHVLSALMADQQGLIALETDLYREELSGLNVAGYIDNQADKTVVIGGHFDHVGYGTRGGSRSPGVVAVHPGADDNASGTAGVLEAARYISSSTINNQNYLFIAFGAEEKGLIGSRYFTESDAYDIEKVNYMFNFDMIGRLEDGALTLLGTGSSPAWDGMIDLMTPDQLSVRKSPGGRGGSDHTSFYVKDIPVLFFFTGLHDDYHRPEDTPDKINYEGAADIIGFGLQMIEHLDPMDRVPFSQTSTSGQARRARADGPVLGLMPDHAYDGAGLRVLAVSDNQPAQRAGLQHGDIIMRINDHEIQEIQTYMEAMGTISAGEKIVLVVKRGEEELMLDVQM